MYLDIVNPPSSSHNIYVTRRLVARSSSKPSLVVLFLRTPVFRHVFKTCPRRSDPIKSAARMMHGIVIVAVVSRVYNVIMPSSCYSSRRTSTLYYHPGVARLRPSVRELSAIDFRFSTLFSRLACTDLKIAPALPRRTRKRLPAAAIGQIV